MAIVGPLYQLDQSDSIKAWNYREKTWYRTKPRSKGKATFSLSTPFISKRSRMIGPGPLRWWFTSANNLGHNICSSYVFGDDPSRGVHFNRAHAKLVDKIRGDYGGIEGGTGLAEYRSSANMAARRLEQLARALRALRRRDGFTFYDELRMSLKAEEVRKSRQAEVDWKRKAAKDAAGLWLESWFGWLPLVNDIWSACNVLQQPPPFGKFSARDGQTFHAVAANTATFGNKADGKGGVRLQTLVRVDNPNVWLANQLGLVNPALTAFQLMPWSWLLNWFVNLEQFLGSYTEWFGLELRNPSTTYFCKSFGQHWNTDPYYNQKLMLSETVMWQRSLGISRPSLRFTNLKALSITRAATASSLVLQLFLDVKKK